MFMTMGASEGYKRKMNRISISKAKKGEKNIPLKK